MAPLLGCIADDYTGATDLASMLARAGLNVIQTFGLAAFDGRAKEERAQLAAADAVVTALKSRSLPADQAVADSLDALAGLRSLGIERYFFKYCSTFDSTPQGNIGPVADALADELAAEQVLFCPAFPENGRTVYCGHLFVGDVPLDESGMRNHPVNPMTDSDLVRVLQAQSNRKVGRLGRAQSQLGTCQSYITDAIDNDDLRHVAATAREHRLLTGGSAIARYWAEQLADDLNYPRRRSDETNALGLQHTNNQRVAVLAGSCSEATREQVARFSATHPTYTIGPSHDDASAEAEQILSWCDRHWHDANVPQDSALLISSSQDADGVRALQQRLGASDAAALIEQTFAGVASGLADRGVRNLIVAGGETSGAVTNALGITAVRIGREIAPGVPWIHSLKTPQMRLALKSGNFGGADFFSEAIEAAE